MSGIASGARRLPGSSRRAVCHPCHSGRPQWQTFLRAHWGEIAGADFFTTEVWTWRGLVTYYTLFMIDLASRRVQTTNGSRDGSVEFWDIFTGVTTPIANLQDPFARSLWLPSMLQKYVPVDDRPLPRLVSQ